MIFEAPLELRFRANRYLQHFRPVFRNPYTIYSIWESLGSFWWAPITDFGRFGDSFWDSDGIFLAVFRMPSPNNAKNAKNTEKNQDLLDAKIKYVSGLIFDDLWRTTSQQCHNVSLSATAAANATAAQQCAIAPQRHSTPPQCHRSQPARQRHSHMRRFSSFFDARNGFA